MISPTTTPQHQFNPNPPPAYTRVPHNSQHLAPLTGHAHYHSRSTHTSSTTSSSRDEEPEVLSLASSEGGGETGSYSSYESASPERSHPSNFSRGNGGPPRSHDMPLRARDVPAQNFPLRARGLPEPSLPHPPPPPPESQESVTWQSHDPTPFSSEDYTKRVRYPNNSRILVQPLIDEDISLKSEGVEILRARDPPIVQGEKDSRKEPVFCDRSKFDFYQKQPQGRGQGTLSTFHIDNYPK